MLTGVEYLVSEDKENYDRRIARLLAPASTLASLGARATFGYEIYRDKRVGQHGKLSEVRKIKTLDEDGSSLGSVAERFRKYGLDETPQVDSILNGELSVVGRRQLVPDEYDLMRDMASRTNNGRELLVMWDDLVLPYKCGFLSSLVLEGHSTGVSDVERRLQLDVLDSVNASEPHDKLLVRSFLKAALSNRLKYGSLPIGENESEAA